MRPSLTPSVLCTWLADPGRHRSGQAVWGAGQAVLTSTPIPGGETALIPTDRSGKLRLTEAKKHAVASQQMRARNRLDPRLLLGSHSPCTRARPASPLHRLHGDTKNRETNKRSSAQLHGTVSPLPLGGTLSPVTPGPVRRGYDTWFLVNKF